MNELERALTGESAAAPPSHILESLPDLLAHREIPGASHTIYAELWHIAFWQQVSLDWIAGKETPVPAHAAAGFPTEQQTTDESWDQLRARFFASLDATAIATRDESRLVQMIRCPSPPGQPIRIMPVHDQLVSLVAHNAYHFGRIVLLRQMMHAWPPPSGGFTW